MGLAAIRADGRAASGIERLAAHLFRRAAFGATAAQIDAAVKQSPAAVVEQIVRGSEDTSDFRRQSDELAMTLLSTGESPAARRLVGVRHAPHDPSAASSE